jgi:hypothetical protein
MTTHHKPSNEGAKPVFLTQAKFAIFEKRLSMLKL